MVKNIRFATVQDYLDCDNVRRTAVWAWPESQRNTPEYRKMLREKRWGVNYVRLPKNNARKIRSKILHPDGRWSKEARIKHSECVKNYWSNANYKKKILEQRNSPEYKKMLSDRIRQKQKMNKEPAQ
jgi:hypothetical protein